MFYSLLGLQTWGLDLNLLPKQKRIYHSGAGEISTHWLQVIVTGSLLNVITGNNQPIWVTLKIESIHSRMWTTKEKSNRKSMLQMLLLQLHLYEVLPTSVLVFKIH